MKDEKRKKHPYLATCRECGKRHKNYTYIRLNDDSGHLEVRCEECGNTEETYVA